MQSITPECTHSGLGSSAFARRYLRNRVFFLFLRVLRCFTSPGALCPTYLIQPGVTGHYPSRVPPFGDLRIIAYLRLPEAFRSLSRPSSAISALASTLRSCSLDLASSMQTYCLLRLVGTVCSQSLFCLFLCSFQGASSAAPALRAVAATRVEHLRFRQPLVGLSPSLDRVYTPADS